MKTNLKPWSVLKYALLFGTITTLLTGCIIWRDRGDGRGRGDGREHDHDDGPRQQDYEHR